jgi:hypothetical protein
MAASPPFIFGPILTSPEYIALDDESLDIPSIVTRLTHPIETRLTQSPTDNVELSFWAIWNAFIAVAVTSPEKHEKLFQVLKEISSLPELKIDGVTAKLMGHAIWTDMPIWKLAVGSKFNNFGCEC